MRARASAILGVVIALAAIGGCSKTNTATQAQLADDIDAIESALNDRDRELNEEGVVVAYRSTPGTFAEPGKSETTTPTTPESPPDESQTTEGDPRAGPVGVEPVTPDLAQDDAPALQSRAPSEEPTPNLTVRDGAGVEREKSSRRNRRAKSARSSPPTRCERLCSLAQTTCDLRDRICTMADRHFGDVRYATSCQRAEDQCEAVRSQCESCAA